MTSSPNIAVGHASRLHGCYPGATIYAAPIRPIPRLPLARAPASAHARSLDAPTMTVPRPRGGSDTKAVGRQGGGATHARARRSERGSEALADPCAPNWLAEAIAA